MKQLTACAFSVILLFCGSPSISAKPASPGWQEETDAPTTTNRQEIEQAVKAGAIRIQLRPAEPGKSKVRLRWSPKGSKLQLTQSGSVSRGQIQLAENIVVKLELAIEKLTGQLKIDSDLDGQFSPDEIIEIKPSQRRGKTWYSTTATIELPFGESVRPYPISLWHVVDPEDESSRAILRFSRRGWHQGTFKFQGKTCHAMICDRNNDGIFDKSDAFGLGTTETETFEYKNTTHSIAKHGWLGEVPFRVTSCDPDGQFLVIEAFDLGRSREEDLKQQDPYLADRNQKRATQPVKFLNKFDDAVKLGSAQDKFIVVDFVTSWCGPCRVMDQLVYTAEPIVKESQDFVFVKLDGDQEKELVKRFDVRAYPTLVVLNSEGVELKKVTGYQSVKKLTQLLRDVRKQSDKSENEN